jgi:hypothetical protein
MILTWLASPSACGRLWKGVGVAIRGCVVVGVDGSHGAGKSTLVHALVSHYRRLGVNAVSVEEPARSSPLFEDAAMHGIGDFDAVVELDLFGSMMTRQLRAARHRQLLITDKTLFNVLAYATLLLPGDDARPFVLRSIEAACHVWAPLYDAVLYCGDLYDTSGGSDPHRAPVLHMQEAADRSTFAVCRRYAQRMHVLPRGLEVRDRVEWVAQRIDDLLGSARHEPSKNLR